MQKIRKKITEWRSQLKIIRYEHMLGAPTTSPPPPPPHIAQNIVETCQKYFQSFIAIEILPQHFCQLFPNISLQHYNVNFLKYFCK